MNRSEEIWTGVNKSKQTHARGNTSEQMRHESDVNCTSPTTTRYSQTRFELSMNSAGNLENTYRE